MIRFWLNKLRLNGPTLTGWYYLFICAIVLGGAIIRDVNLLMLLAGLLLAPLILNGHIAGRMVREHEPNSIFTRHGIRGDLVTVTIDLNSRGHSVAWFSVQDQIEHPATNAKTRTAGQKQPLLIPVSRQRGQGSYRFRPTLRGRYEFTACEISTAYPWGLASRGKNREGSNSILVYPRLGRIVRNPFELSQQAWQGSSQTQVRQGEGGEFYGLRDWRPGDLQRSVHWRATARHGTLVVRQTEQPRRNEFVIVLELWQPEDAQAQHRTAVETAISYAATLTAEICRRGGSRLRIVMLGHTAQILNGFASPRFAEEAWEALAVVEAQSEKTSVNGEFVPRHAERVLWISTRETDPRAEESWSAVAANRLRILRVASPEFAEWFQFENDGSR